MPPSDIHVRFEDVTKTFPGRGRKDPAQQVLRGIDLEIHRGEIFGIIGQSGAGKSTLVRLINGLEPVTSGRITVGDRVVSGLSERQLRAVRREIGMIFQQFNLFRSRTVAGNVAYPLKVAGVKQPERDRKVARLLDFVGLLQRANDHPEQLSGGQQQRVGIARALATDPSLLLADEATSALDPETTQDVLSLLKQVNRELGITIVIITHEMDVIRQIADRVAVIDSGHVVESGSAYDIFAAPKTPEATRFVSSTLRDRPSAATLERLRVSHPGRLVTVRVQDRPAFQNSLSVAFLQRDVTADLVFGGISELQDRPVGSLTYSLTGGEGSVDELLKQLRADGFDLDEHEGASR
ncbi:methionine ABC transporter ATP-binding protein [Kineosporia mesophila]|uniref:Methionine ABC transporter ATP-binding protein n=1 Tax=Kineosporia mesophila TaxID=566012 RepID=A0ABP7ATE5_9ACTN|nr:methionine ABC transporter ATP-binding protein [Kineosporia mesophila]